MGIDTDKAKLAVFNLLEAIGEDPRREGLRDTPRRVAMALLEMTAGREDDVKSLLKVTFDGGDYDEVVALAGIPFTSLCEHHLLPFSGFAGVAYLPGGDASHRRVVGLSKIARTVDAFARRLQLQERLSVDIADALAAHLDPRGVAVVLEAEHACMGCRGVKKPGSVMRTSVMRGVFKTHSHARVEVMDLLRRTR